MNGAATPPELVLDAQDDAEWFMATLPLAQSWVPVDISRFRYLRLCVAISRTAAARMSVRLVSMSENGTENSSTEITLPSLETDIVHMNTIKLAEFTCEGFDYSRVRRLDVMGHGSYCATLSRIVFE